MIWHVKMRKKSHRDGKCRDAVVATSPVVDFGSKLQWRPERPFPVSVCSLAISRSHLPEATHLGSCLNSYPYSQLRCKQTGISTVLIVLQISPFLLVKSRHNGREELPRPRTCCSTSRIRRQFHQASTVTTALDSPRIEGRTRGCYFCCPNQNNLGKLT